MELPSLRLAGPYDDLDKLQVAAGSGGSGLDFDFLGYLYGLAKTGNEEVLLTSEEKRDQAMQICTHQSARN